MDKGAVPRTNNTADGTAASDMTPLYRAVLRNDVPGATFLLEQGTDPKCSISSCLPSIMQVAARSPTSDMLHVLADHGATIDHSHIYDGKSLLHLAASANNTSAMHILLQRGFPVDYAPVAGITPLHEAAFSGCYEATQFLVDRGSKIEIHNAFQRTPLHDAVSGGNMRVIHALIKAGASIDARDDSGETPLFKAVKLNKYAIVKQLLAVEANQTITGRGDITPLHTAAYLGNPDIVDLLLAYHAPVNAQNIWRRTPLHDAFERYAFYDRFSFGLSVDRVFESIIKNLLEHGASVSITDETGKCPPDVEHTIPYDRIRIYQAAGIIKALSMAQHKRLGQDSPAHSLSRLVLENIMAKLLQ